MSQAIGRPSSSPTPQLVTPTGTPPITSPHHNHTHGAPTQHSSSFEARLHLLLSNFDSGTHSFCREERESPEEKALALGRPLAKALPAGRPPTGFLSALSLTRPSSSSSTPAQTPVSTSFPNGLAMTTTISSDMPLVHSCNSLPTGQLPQAPIMARAQTSEAIKGFHVQEGKRHFDPSREPKLLGLL